MSQVAMNVEVSSPIENPSPTVVDNEPRVDGLFLKAVGLQLSFTDGEKHLIKPNQSWGYITFRPRGEPTRTYRFILLRPSSVGKTTPYTLMQAPVGASKSVKHQVDDNNRRVIKVLTKAIASHYEMKYDIRVVQIHFDIPEAG